MSNSGQAIATTLAEQWAKLSERERHVMTHLLHRKTVSRDVSKLAADQLTAGERLADKVAAFGGSWKFILLFLGMMAVWMGFNIQSERRFDVYPFILLNLVLSCLAALQAPVIMMSQNRQAVRDRLDAQHDYEINLKAEMEILGLHSKVDELREKQWEDMIALQQRQLELLDHIVAKLCPDEIASRS